MTQSDPTSRRPGLWTALAATAVAGASAVTIAMPPTTATADPVPPPPPSTTAAPAAPASPAPAAPAPDPNAPAQPAPPPPPADPNAPPPPPADPNAPPPPPADPNAPPPPPADPNAPPPPPADPNAPPPPPADPNAPPAAAPAADAGRVENAAGGFSYILPAGWEVADASRLSYGQALLLKQVGPAPLPGQPAQTATDTSVLLGRLDMKLFAGAEPDNTKAAVRLASDMGEFFMPFPGSRINQQTTALQAGDMPGYAASYEVKFTDTNKPNGQIWAGVVGTAGARNQPGDRWFVVWLGTSKDPIDAAGAKALAESIRPYSPPPPPPVPAADPNAPAAPPAPGNRVGVPIPVETPVPEMMPAPA